MINSTLDAVDKAKNNIRFCFYCGKELVPYEEYNEFDSITGERVKVVDYSCPEYRGSSSTRHQYFILKKV